MSGHRNPDQQQEFIAGIAFGIVVFPAGAGPFIVWGAGKEIQDRDMNKMVPPLRSFLFAPGNHARRVEKALSLDADAVILDLEDAVAIAEKPATREVVAAALERPRQGLI